MRRRPPSALVSFVLLACLGLVAANVLPAARAQDAEGSSPHEPDVDGAPRLAEPSSEPAVAASATVSAAVADVSTPSAPSELTSLPTGLGLPVQVHVGVSFTDLRGVQENEQLFDATLDVRVTWQDRRLAYPASETPRGFRAFGVDEVDAELSRIWEPGLRFANLEGEPRQLVRGLRIRPEGHVELMLRVEGTFHAAFDVERFPFDRQALTVEIVAGRYPRELAALVFRQVDLDYTRFAPGAEADGWHARSVDLSRRRVQGWHGETHDVVDATLVIERAAAETAAPIFIPLLAALLIPLLAIWLNRLDEGEFKIEAFELANVIVGGLFAIIALNFTVSAEFATLASGDNTVSRLFSLNYLTLAASLAVNLLIFRYRVMLKAFGPFVEEQFFGWLTWAIPTAVIATAIATVLVAYA